MEQARIRRLMPDKDPVSPAPLPVNFGQRRAKRQNAVIAFEVEPPHAFRIRDGAMMSVMKEQHETCAVPSLTRELGNQKGLIPFVRDNEIHVLQRARQAERVVIFRRGQLRIGRSISGKTCFAMILHEMGEAPGAFRLERADRMAQDHELA